MGLQNIKKYPEPTDAVACILSGDVAKRLITDPMVRGMQELIQELLDLDCLPAYDSNFFHVGGSSLLASQLASKIRKKYSCEFSGTDVFRHNTCLGMARHVQKKKGGCKSSDNVSLSSSASIASLSFLSQPFNYFYRSTIVASKSSISFHISSITFCSSFPYLPTFASAESPWFSCS